MEISFEGFGRPLRNTVHSALSAEYHPVRARPLT
jgi:hypothetical protein